MFAREPVFWLNVVKALVALGVVFGVQITDDQTTAIAEVVVLVVTLIGGHFVQRQLVTPAAAPALKEGTTATVLDAAGAPIGVTTVELAPEVAGGDEGAPVGDVVGGAGVDTESLE